MVFDVDRTKPFIGEDWCDVHQIGWRLGEIGNDLLLENRGGVCVREKEVWRNMVVEGGGGGGCKFEYCIMGGGRGVREGGVDRVLIVDLLIDD